MSPLGVIAPIWFLLPKVNHMFPSGPAVIAPPPLSGVGRGNSVMTPAGVIRPIALATPPCVNQRFPSGPAVMSQGSLTGVGRGNSVITPAGVIRPIALPTPLFSVNHT